MKTAKTLLWMFVPLLFAQADLQAARLEAATASVEITAPEGYPMGGYSARQGINQGVHDPLMAKVLILKKGELKVALVTYDLIGFNSRRVPAVAREELGIPYVLQIASHTHSGPVPRNREQPEQDSWFQAVENKVIQALREARFVPARLAVTETSALLGHNRRKINPDGSVTMFWRNAERIPTSPVDPTVGIIRLLSDDGKDLAVIVNYACHAVVLGPDNLQYSADWPGFMYRKVESELGGSALCFFVPGAAGDINPYNDKQPVNEKGFGIAREMGEALAARVLDAVRRPASKTEAEPVLEIAQPVYVFKNRFAPEREMEVQVSHVRLGEDTAFIAIPGEVFVDHQIELRTRSPLRHTFLFGFAYSGSGTGAGYVPTIRAAMEGGYGASYATRIEVGAGEQMMDRMIIWAYEQLGMLPDVPGVP